jgi:hypothetical protein
MENPKKRSIDKKQDAVQEPVAIYGKEELNQILHKENVVGFDVDGNPISEKEYVADIQNALNLLAERKLETYSSEEVKRRVLG